MNKYEVFCITGSKNFDMLKVIEAEDEKQARKIMWEQHMDDTQKNNCADIEVFPLEETTTLNLKPIPLTKEEIKHLFPEAYQQHYGAAHG